MGLRAPLALLATGCLLLAALSRLVRRETAGPVRIVPAATRPAAASSAAGVHAPQPGELDEACWAAGGDFAARYRCMLQLPPPRARSQPRAVASGAAPRACEGNCSGRGQCQPSRGPDGVWGVRCACRPGWAGERCEVRDASPCNAPEGGRVLTRCAGHCDDDVNRCYCGAGSRFPHRPMPWCVFDGIEKTMPWQTPAWAGFARGARSAFWSDGAPSTAVGARVAWCDADPALRQTPLVRCKCYDGQDAGAMCAPVSDVSVEAML